MTRSFALLLLLLIPLVSASAQSARDAAQGIWEHTFDNENRSHTVYLHFDGDILEVWRISEKEECEMYPSIIEWNDRELSVGATVTWSIASVSDNNLHIDFPDGRSVHYKRARLEPRSLCGGRDI